MLIVALMLAQVPLGVAAEGIKDAGATEEATAEDNGLTGDNAWISPQFGIEVDWGDDWSPNHEETVSDPGAGRDQLRLTWNRPDANLRVIVLDEGRGGPPDDVAYWTSDEYIDDAYAQVQETSILLEEPGSATEDGAVLVGLADPGDPQTYIHYSQSVATTGGGALYLLLDAPVDSWPAVLEAAQASVTVDGNVPFEVFEQDEVQDAVADAPTAEYSLEGAGLEEDGRWVSPAFGYELAWPESWGPNQRVQYPVRSKVVVPFDEVHIAENDPESDPPPYFDFYATYVRQTTAAQELAILVDPDWVSLGFREEVEVTVLLSDTSDTEAESLVAVTYVESGNVEYAWFRFARDDDRADLYIYLKARSDGFEDAWDTMTNGEIALDGDAIETIFRWDDIEPAIADFEG